MVSIFYLLDQSLYSLNLTETSQGLLIQKTFTLEKSIYINPAII